MTLIKSPVLLCLLLLCTACALQGSPAEEPSPARTATAQPTSTLLPTPTPSPTPMFQGLIDSLAVAPQGTLYAGGYGTPSDTSRRLAQWDGAKWIDLETGFEPASSSLVTDGAGRLYTSGLTDPEQGSTTVMMRWDGAGWEDITANFVAAVDALKAGRISSNIPVLALAADGEDHLYAAGSFQYPSADYTAEWPMGYVAMWDQGTWTVLGEGFDKMYIYAMAVSPAGDVYVAGEQPRVPPGESGIAGFVAGWDGKTWTDIGTGELDPCGNFRNLALDGAGGLYASCAWSGPGELIFYWDGTDWTTIADRLQGEAPAVFDMAVDENGSLYIGGSFDAVNGVPARNIAYWDGNAWHALGEGTRGQVYGLAFDPGGELYAAGLLTEAGGQPAHLAARWDGDAWHPLGP